ncbi:hypothetical protein [Burkholderia pseudomallei]|uniref:hypothetical protein n=1 Tax=Burkholderia pseudomallei TaxID=28450 RepID=UPI001E65195C|nr:hypothetical protein [Burkholderia pseudomallei]
MIGRAQAAVVALDDEAVRHVLMRAVRHPGQVERIGDDVDGVAVVGQHGCVRAGRDAPAGIDAQAQVRVGAREVGVEIRLDAEQAVRAGLRRETERRAEAERGVRTVVSGGERGEIRLNAVEMLGVIVVEGQGGRHAWRSRLCTGSRPATAESSAAAFGA